MSRRSIPAACFVVVLLAGFNLSSASAAAPTEVAIQIAPTIPSPCNFSCGTWSASGAINDVGTYVRVDIDSAPPNRSFFEFGPFFETFVLTSGRGSFTIKAEERQIGVFTSVGVYQLEAGAGAYASASGHGEASSTFPVPVLFLTGVATTG
jgi:hypothetical protein